MRLIEPLLFASPPPVSRKNPAHVVGQGALVHLFGKEISTDLDGQTFEVGKVIAGWMSRTGYAIA